MHKELSDNQRRFVCRILFLLLCAFPTAFVVYQACHRKSADDWAQLIQSHLSLETQIGSVETPRPNEAVLRDVQFADENGNIVLSAMEATILFGKKNQIIVKDQVRLKSAGLNRIISQVADKIVNPHLNNQTWSIVIHKAVIDSDQDSFTGDRESLLLTPVMIDIVPNGDTVLAKLSATRGTNQNLDENWVVCELAKSRDSDQFQFQIDTRACQPLPCWLAYDWFPELRKFGNQAGFKGWVSKDLASVTGGMKTSLQGEFHDVDVSQFVTGSAVRDGELSSIFVKRCSFPNDNEYQMPPLSGTDRDGDGIDDVLDVDQTGGADLNGDGLDDALVDGLDAWLVLNDGTSQPIRLAYSEVRKFDVDHMIRAAAWEADRQSADSILR